MNNRSKPLTSPWNVFRKPKKENDKVYTDLEVGSRPYQFYRISLDSFQRIIDEIKKLKGNFAYIDKIIYMQP